jgi:hypothetical protein
VFLFPAAGWTRAALDGFLAFGLWTLETQKAPSRIAPTNTKTAHAARTLSFTVRSTRHTSITIVLAPRLAERCDRQKQISCWAAAGICAQHIQTMFARNVMKLERNFQRMNGYIRDE